MVELFSVIESVAPSTRPMCVCPTHTVVLDPSANGDTKSIHLSFPS